MSDSGFASARLRRGDITTGEKLWQISWSLIFVICCIFAFGFAMLYSAANGNFQPWAVPQLARFILGLGMIAVLAVIDVRLLLRYAYAFYGIVFVLLVIVDLNGFVGGGAQRWLDFGFMNLQPSELMKPAIVLVLARYFHHMKMEEIGSPLAPLLPVVMVMAPVGLIIAQPDLGTGLLIIMGSGIMLFMAGVRIWKFLTLAVVGLAAIPIIWPMLHDYQKDRLRTLWDPERDPLGTGYHILQSKIALGSGGLFGKGFMAGTQSHLNFLPERQTDFIFTMLAEELGMIGGLVLLSLYVILLIYGYAIAFRCRHQFGRLVAIGISAGFFLYFSINIAMVMGIIPVVGVTLPFISYGGTSLLTLMFCVGLLMNVHVHRDVRMGVPGSFKDF